MIPKLPFRSAFAIACVQTPHTRLPLTDASLSTSLTLCSGLLFSDEVVPSTSLLHHTHTYICREDDWPKSEGYWKSVVSDNLRNEFHADFDDVINLRSRMIGHRSSLLGELMRWHLFKRLRHISFSLLLLLSSPSLFSILLLFLLLSSSFFFLFALLR